MSFMQWSEHFLTGIAEVDAQHRGLVDLINGAAPLLSRTGAPKVAEIAPLLDELFAYAATHFRTEERLMRRQGIDRAHLEQHLQSHATFTEEVVQMREQLEGGGGLDGSELLRFLSSWLSFHILGEDRDMAQQLALIARGTAPGAALLETQAAHRQSSAHVVLNEALLDLFSLYHQRNRALAAANEEKLRSVGRLAAGLAHELNTPVQYVGASIEFLQGAFPALVELLDAYRQRLEPEARSAPELAALEERTDREYLLAQLPSALDSSLEGLRRVAELVQSVKRLGQPDASGKALEDLNAEVSRCVSATRAELQEVAEVRTILGALPPVPCRPEELRQVLLSLLSNSSDAIRERGPRGHIEVGTRQEGSQAVVWIADDGAGMSDEVASHVFEPFFTTKPVGKGAGQGLTIARSIVVDRHGGELAFDTTPGKGTTFYVRLPLGAALSR